ncbi:MAG TPA: N-formylglutamate amidohydrolase [Acetobacteraceae bacterium]|jgi:predicted N-formylglutamate amidohydrolase
MDQPTILAPGEPHPVLTRRECGTSPIVLISDHAGRRVPARLGSLGLADSALRRHIGWDIGIWAVTELLADSLDAVAIGQAYSRLVIDNNRPTDVPGSIPIISETTDIPGNTGIAEAERAARYSEIMRPYHARIAAELDRRAGQPVFLISMHSFTPVYMGIARPWHIGTLYYRDFRLARALFELLGAEPGLVVGDNEPYAVSDQSDYSIPVHGEARGLPHVGLEIRQDLITDAAGQQRWAALLARLLPMAVSQI